MPRLFAKCTVRVKNKDAKHVPKAILEKHYSCFAQKTAWKNSKYSRTAKILKIVQLVAHVKAIDFAKMVSLGQKLKMPKTCEKFFYKNISSCCVQKTALKSTKYSRKKTILKISHVGEAIAHA